MRFRVASEIVQRHPDAFIALVAARGVSNATGAAITEELLRAAEAEARERLAGTDVQSHPFIARWRDAFRDVGLNPNKYKSSVEALLTRVLKGDGVPALAAAVNLANAVSLRYVLPVGAHDADGLVGDLEVRVAGDGETFTPIGSALPEAVEAGEPVYGDAQQVRTRRWIWRQGDGSKVTADSRTILYPIDGWVGLNEEDVREAARELARLLTEHLGAEATVAFVHRENPEVGVFESGTPPREGATTSPVRAAEASGSGAPAMRVAERADDVPAGIHHGTPAMRVAEREPDEIDALLSRAVVDVIVRADLEKRLRAGDKLRVKFGIDPTGPRIHIGRAVPLRKLRQFQELGHTICLIIGDFTAQIGDVSGHDQARRLLTEMEVYENMASYKAQIGRILDVDKVEWSYNSDWLGQLRFKDVIGLSTHFTVAQMLEREAFSQRYAEGKPIGLHEFFYPLMQGYDSYAINADVEVGGTDQLFNLMAGRTIQRAFARRPQDVLTLGMIWGLDGRKMSTSEGNTILIDEPPTDMYGKIMSMGDEHIVPYFAAATAAPLRDIREIERELAAGLNPMVAKKRLAYEITRLYHGDVGAREGQRYFEELHQGKGQLGDEDWPEVAISGDAPRQVGQLFVEAGLATSNSDARRTLAQGGLEIDGERVSDFATLVTPRTGMKLRRGKNKLARLRVVT